MIRKRQNDWLGNTGGLGCIRRGYASLDALREPPFSSIGDPEALFGKSELEELLKLTQAAAA